MEKLSYAKSAISGQAAQQRRGAKDRGEYRQAPKLVRRQSWTGFPHKKRPPQWGGLGPVSPSPRAPNRTLASYGELCACKGQPDWAVRIIWTVASLSL